MGEGGYVMDGGGGVVMDLQVELFGELLGGVGGSIYGGSLMCGVSLVMWGDLWLIGMGFWSCLMWCYVGQGGCIFWIFVQFVWVVEKGFFM